MLPGTELAFADNVRYDNRWIWTRTANFRVGKFNAIDTHIPDRHHDAIEFPDGSHVLVTLLCEGQRVTVLQMPVTHPISTPAHTAERAPAARSLPVG
jgi:predicted ester cyclase